MSSESELPAAGNLKNRVDKNLKLSIPRQNASSSNAKAQPVTAPALNVGQNQFCDQFADVAKISTSWSPKSFDEIEDEDYFVSTPGSFKELRE